MPGISGAAFFGLSAMSFVTAFIGVFTGGAGGLILLATMAMVMPTAALIPVHTVIQLGSGLTRTIIMWRHVMRGTVLPFVIGAGLGAAAGARIVVALPTAWLLLFLGIFILTVTWMPSFGRVGGERNRFAILGFACTFLGMFVSATGSLLLPFVASAAPSRHNHVATVGALMTISHIAKIAAFGFIGFAVGSYLPLMGVMILTGAAGNWVGELALDRTSERRFRLILRILLTALGVRLLWSAAVEAGWF